MTLSFLAAKSVKDKIILVLGDKWPLKAKEMLSYLKHNLNANVTYQAVYKSLNELIEEKIVEKTEQGFILNKEWVVSLRDYTTYVDQSYKIGIPKNDMMDSEQTTVNCIWDWYYHALVMMEKLANEQYATKLPLIIRATHHWNGLVIGKEEFMRAAKVIKKYEMYVAVCTDTPLGQMLTKYWEDMGVHVARVDKDNFLETSNDIVVIGDYVIQAIYPKELIDDLDKFFDETKNVEEMDIASFQKDIFYKKSDIHIITVKNKPLADKLRKETLGFY